MDDKPSLKGAWSGTPFKFRWAPSIRKRRHDRKKSQKGYISPICGEAPTEAIYMKICLLGDVLDVITCAKIQNEIFRGYDFTGGWIFHFPTDFWMGLLRYCAACDCCLWHNQLIITRFSSHMSLETDWWSMGLGCHGPFSPLEPPLFLVQPYVDSESWKYYVSL